MSLIYCPECGHEVSANAVACANCGFPMQAAPAPVEPLVERDVVVSRPVQRKGFPPWAIAPIVLGGLALVFLMFLLFRSPNDEANVNVAVNANARRQAELARETKNETVPATGTQTVTVPPSGSAPVSIPPPPPSSQTTVPETSTSLPPVAPPTATRGSVVISARIVAPRSSSPAAARNAKFYLLDKDVETILSEARVEPIEGNTLSGSMGLAAVFPDRYGDFQRAAMRAIGRHVKYSGTTDGGGKANLSNVEPKEYYLFGVTRVAGGFALWSSPISIIAGQNMLDLSPQSVTEISDNSGD